MSLKQPRDTSMVPPGGLWIYENPEDSFRIRSPYYENLKREVKQYRRSNSYPIGANFDEEFDVNICRNAPSPSACVDYIPPTLLEKASALTRALYRWGRSGFKTRSPEECESVMAICRGCEYFSGQSGILKVACRKCGCGGLKQYLASSHCPVNKW